MVGFTTYSIVKHRLMDINIVLKKGDNLYSLDVAPIHPILSLDSF